MLKYVVKRSMPCIPGVDFSGTVEEIGAAVTGFKPGDEVYGSVDIFKDEARGSYAEYAFST